MVSVIVLYRRPRKFAMVSSKPSICKEVIDVIEQRVIVADARRLDITIT